MPYESSLITRCSFSFIVYVYFSVFQSNVKSPQTFYNSRLKRRRAEPLWRIWRPKRSKLRRRESSKMSSSSHLPSSYYSLLFSQCQLYSHPSTRYHEKCSSSIQGKSFEINTEVISQNWSKEPNRICEKKKSLLAVFHPLWLFTFFSLFSKSNWAIAIFSSAISLQKYIWINIVWLNVKLRGRQWVKREGPRYF